MPQDRPNRVRLPRAALVWVTGRLMVALRGTRFDCDQVFTANGAPPSLPWVAANGRSPPTAADFRTIKDGPQSTHSGRPSSALDRLGSVRSCHSFPRHWSAEERHVRTYRRTH